MPEVAFTDEDRRQEIEELRASLGLHIEEPASDSQEEQQQMSALQDIVKRQGGLLDHAQQRVDNRVAGDVNRRRRHTFAQQILLELPRHP